MRLWSLHPRYLDRAGLTGCWREALLARKVLAGETIGYRNHPQLERFRRCAEPMVAIDSYLGFLYEEACRRRYRFDREKFCRIETGGKIPVQEGQLRYEYLRLYDKLVRRSPDFCVGWVGEPETIDPHPLFYSVPGGVEAWEKIPESPDPSR